MSQIVSYFGCRVRYFVLVSVILISRDFRESFADTTLSSFLCIFSLDCFADSIRSSCLSFKLQCSSLCLDCWRSAFKVFSSVLTKFRDSLSLPGLWSWTKPKLKIRVFKDGSLSLIKSHTHHVLLKCADSGNGGTSSTAQNAKFSTWDRSTHPSLFSKASRKQRFISRVSLLKSI